MSALDWGILCATLLFIIWIGMYKSRGQKDLKGYFLSDNSLAWYKVMFSVMATQASAITFLSAPGLAYTDGLRFIHIYFGMPLAIIMVTAFLVPAYRNMRVITAYEFLENRFNLHVRIFTAFLFLVQRGLATGITIYAPALVLSTLLGWNIYLTCTIMGVLVVFYTLSGGAKAVAYTQLQQMLVILGGMIMAGILVFKHMPDGIGFKETLWVAGASHKLNAMVTSFSFDDDYNIWSGLLGGFFLSLSYFGTDQSQVGRYLGGKSIKESTTGLLMNAIIKIPMQLGILFIGIGLFVFFIFNPGPIIYNDTLIEQVKNSDSKHAFLALEKEFQHVQQQHKETALQLVQQKKNRASAESISQTTAHLEDIYNARKVLRDSAATTIKRGVSGADTKDVNYIFLHFVLHFLPVGFVGLLIAVIFSASWSSTSSELNALSGTLVNDFYKRVFKPGATDEHYLLVSRIATAAWGVIAILFAFLATRLNSLIEAVNTLGSLFYGTILGVFVVAFIGRRWSPNAVLLSGILAQTTVFFLYSYDVVSYLWFNLIACVQVVVVAYIIDTLSKTRTTD